MKAIRTFLFIIVIILILGIISLLFPKEGVMLGGQKFYFPLLEDIFASDSSSSSSASQRIKEIEESLLMKQQQDSIALAYQDSLSFYMDFFQTHPSRIYFPNNDWSYLNSLFESLDSCETNDEIVHILHYGDSQIESDRISSYIRKKLQEKFGGFGPGLVPAVQAIPSLTVAQTASENIDRYIISGNFIKQPKHRRYGAMGQVAHVSGSSWISVTARNEKNVSENVKEFSKIRLYAGNTRKGFKATLTSPNNKPISNVLKENKSELSVISWDLQNPVRKFSLQLSGFAEIYGIAVDGNHGVAVDNIALRGSSGTFFTNIDSLVMKPMLNDLNVGLIILEFGGNMIPFMKKEKNVEDYKSKMIKQIAYFQELCPNSKILLIGPADMSTKVNGKLQTYPMLETTVNELKTAALESGIAFWNMYEVMGGANSMIDWVKSKPPLAAPDYIHFSIKGADRIAELFYESLMIYYDYYNFQKNNKMQLMLTE
jgi:lysophospholipase L1-like esterase